MDALEPDDPRQVGRYRLLSRLGAGGMGRVFLGQSPGGRLVAVKLIRAELADDPGFRLRFAQEVAAARRVSGIFTAPVVDADPDGPQPWLVTAFVDGPSLADAVTARGAMPVSSVLTLAAGLAEGLSAVHAAGVVHRDLKPSNVLLASDGPHIIDFGISRAADSAWLTVGGGIMGSPGFMSPEQAEGGPVGPAADIFSLGGLLAFAATGEPPFGAGPASALLYRVVYGTAATSHVPAQLRNLVERCLDKDPARRPTADQLAEELGYAQPADGWQSWPAALATRSRELAVTELDHRSGLEREESWSGAVPWPGLQLAFAEPADPEPRRAPPAESLPARRRTSGAHSRPVAAPAGARPRRRAPAAVAGVGLAAGLAVASAVAILVAVESRGNQAAAPSGSSRGGEQFRSAASHLAADTAAGSPAPSASADPAAAVESYFAAVDDHHWRQAWNRGGRHLSSSYPDMVAFDVATSIDAIRSIRIVGDHAIVRLRARSADGATQLYEIDFTVRDGVIVHGSQRLIS
jgi:serine/threonine protein kinase